MAQQTINVGAAPNDGTGTPLRTAFQYTNSNFSELYTAVGPSGNNIVVPGSATITGDLTVDTNVLKVDSTGNAVGIGSASPAANTLTIGNSRFILCSESQSKFGDSGIVNGGAADGNTQIQYFGGKALFFNEGASNTKMTLNSTGLGVGGSVLAKISAYLTSTATYNSAAAGDDTDFQISRVNNSTVSGQSSTIALNSSADNGANIARVYLACVQESSGSYASSFTVKTRNSVGTNAERFRIDSIGNVGIGITPSAWTSAFGPVLQFKSSGSSGGGSLTGSSADNFRMFANTYYDGDYKYIAAGFATQYEQAAGSHVWYLSGTTAGAINGTIPFSTALSLDKTGSLVLGSAAVATTATDGFLYIPSCAGAPTGVPTAKTGRVPMVVDSTNNRFYVYVSGTWKYTTLA